MRFYTAGESHGKALLCIVEGIPYGLNIDFDFVNHELSRRQMGFGRGARMKLEKDRAEFLSGVIGGVTTGAPIAIMIANRDWENWRDYINPVYRKSGKEVFVPRPGHADYAGCKKYGIIDARPILERSSARETAARVAAGAVFKLFLKLVGVEITSCVISIGRVKAFEKFTFDDMKMADSSPVRCPDERISSLMMEEIEKARDRGDTLGGIFEVRARGVPAGLGSHVQWFERIDAQIAFAMMSIQGVKAVSIGDAWDLMEEPGSNYHDEFVVDDGCVKRPTNRAGGIEGGITNGEEVVVKCFMKPIPTLKKGLRSFDLRDKRPHVAHFERSDVCAVPSAAVVAESMLAFVIARAVKEKYGGDSVEELISRVRG